MVMKYHDLQLNFSVLSELTYGGLEHFSVMAIAAYKTKGPTGRKKRALVKSFCFKN